MEYRAKTYSKDGTIKYLFGIFGKGLAGSRTECLIESAFIHLSDREEEKPKYTICLSSQKGCVYACRMCRNMFGGFYGNLTSDELNKQIDLVLEQDRNREKIQLEDAVEYAFMAVGEPLFGNHVINAIKNHEKKVKDTRFALSTVGIPRTIEKLARYDFPYPLRIELSLHFSNDNLRNHWLVQNSFVGDLPELNIEQMLNEAEKFKEKFPEKIALNYVLIDGINNMDENLEEIVRLLEGRKGFYVKVMKPNLTSSMVFSWKGHSRGCSSDTRTYGPKEFRDKLERLGIEATHFESKGTDIAAGCGMMRLRFGDKRGVFVVERIPEANPAKLGFS